MEFKIYINYSNLMNQIYNSLKSKTTFPVYIVYISEVDIIGDTI